MNEFTQKRILLVITKSNFGGAQRYVFEIASALVAEGKKVAVASAGGSGELITRLNAAGITHFPIAHFQRDISFVKEWKVLTELRTVMREFEPTTVHLNSSKAGGVGALAARLSGVSNIIFTAHGWPFLEQRSWLWRTMAWSLSFLTGLLVHKIIVVSENDYRYTPRLLRGKSTVIHTGVQTIPYLERSDARHYFEKTHGAPFSSHSSERWCISTGELTHNKNITSAITALATHNRTAPQKMCLCIVGTGELRAELEAQVAAEGMQSYIFFTGFIPDIPQYLKAFDIFLMPSKKEGFPYGLLEAAQAGLAIVASRVGGIPEIIHSEQAGILINPNQPADMVTAFTTLSDTTVLKQYQTHALAHAERFPLTKMLDRTLRLYQ